jgi:hypothetical protein
MREKDMRSYRWMMVVCLGWLALSCSQGGGTYSLYLRYEPVKDFPSLQQKLGSTVALGPFRDLRPDTVYVGTYIPNQGLPTYFQGEPAPLEQGIRGSVTQALSKGGVKTVPGIEWDGQPEALRTLGTDSILSLEIKGFLTEAKASLFQTHLVTKVSLVIHLGVKKEGKVFTRKVDLEKERTVANWEWGREQMEQTINQTLSEIFDEFFSNPY